MKSNITPGVEGLWAASRLVVASGVLFGSALFLGGSLIFTVYLCLMAFVFCYGAVCLVLLGRHKVFIAFALGFPLDTVVIFVAWWSFVRLSVGALQSNDLYLAILPITVMGIVRLGAFWGSMYAWIWMGWLAWSSIHYYAAQSYDVKQLPIRLAFFLMVQGIVAGVMVVLERERNLERRRLNELEDLERFKSHLLRAVSHELKTPLTAVKTAGEIIANPPTHLTGEQKATARGVFDRGIARLELVTTEALRYADASRPRDMVRVDPTDVGALIQEVATSVQPSFTAKRQRLIRDLPTDLPRVNADQDLLRLALVSILDNANLHTQEGGTVTVRAMRLDGTVRIEIADDGPSIPDREQEHIFQEFYRSAEADRHPSRGLGLGLPTAKRLVEFQGGTIGVVPEQRAGTTIFISFPLLKEGYPS